MPKKASKGGKKKGGKSKAATVGCASSVESKEDPGVPINVPAETLTPSEQQFVLHSVSLSAPVPPPTRGKYGKDSYSNQKGKGGKSGKSGKGGKNSAASAASASSAAASASSSSTVLSLASLASLSPAEQVRLRAVEILDRHNMVILHNVLRDEQLSCIYREYEALLDFSASSAIGEKDASKRSGTRVYNCRCQVGPACGFEGWREGAEETRAILHDNRRGPSVWEQVVRTFGFVHIARVEIVTSHAGCRYQGWHVDGSRGITTIFPLVDMDMPKGPTQMDFTIPFNGLRENMGKVKKLDPACPGMCHAAMPAGGVLMFNANVSHRGTANLSSSDRPILVLDCSPVCDSLGPTSLWDL